MVRVYNCSRDVLLGDRVEVADTFLSRLLGLMFRARLADGGGLILDPCNSIHMLFMRFPIDVIFLDSGGIVVGLLRAIAPWRVSGIYWNAVKAVELPAGVIDASGTEEGDTIAIEPSGPGSV